METNLQLVTLHDRATITNSKIVAEVFGKSHDDVLRAIRDLKMMLQQGWPRNISAKLRRCSQNDSAILRSRSHNQKKDGVNLEKAPAN